MDVVKNCKHDKMNHFQNISTSLVSKTLIHIVLQPFSLVSSDVLLTLLGPRAFRIVPPFSVFDVLSTGERNERTTQTPAICAKHRPRALQNPFTCVGGDFYAQSITCRCNWHEMPKKRSEVEYRDFKVICIVHCCDGTGTETTMLNIKVLVALESDRPITLTAVGKIVPQTAVSYL